MTPNVGSADRVVRILAGIAIIVLGIVYQSWWGAIGGLPLLTGFIKWCPAYLPIGLSTCKKEAPEPAPEQPAQ